MTNVSVSVSPIGLGWGWCPGTFPRRPVSNPDVFGAGKWKWQWPEYDTVNDFDYASQAFLYCNQLCYCDSEHTEHCLLSLGWYWIHTSVMSLMVVSVMMLKIQSAILKVKEQQWTQFCNCSHCEPPPHQLECSGQWADDTTLHMWATGRALWPRQLNFRGAGVRLSLLPPPPQKHTSRIEQRASERDVLFQHSLLQPLAVCPAMVVHSPPQGNGFI